MNMLASLKTLLFSSTSRGTGATPPAASGETPDFAAMLNGSMGEGAPAEPIALPAAPSLPQAEGQAIPVITPDLSLDVGQPAAKPPHDHVPPGLAIAVAAGKDAPDTMPPGHAIGLVKQADLQVEAAAPGDAPTSPPQTTEQAADAALPIKADAPPHRAKASPEAPAATDAEAAPVEPKPARKEKAKADQPKDSAPASAPAAQPIATPAIPVEPAPVLSTNGTAPAEAASITPTPTPTAPAIATPQIAVEPTPGPTPKEPTPVQAAEQSAPATDTAPVAQTVAPLAPMAEPTPVARGGKSAPAGDTAKPGARNDAKIPESNPDQTPRPAADQSASVASDTAPAAPILNGKPVKAEALALLQLVREQVAARQSGTSSAPVGEQVSAAARIKNSPPAPVADAAPNPSLTATPADITPLATAAAPPLATSPVATPAVPAVDLSASLGAQVVDMGVSGQWIDGLARDIAGLSANGAQGRFQVNTGHLGAVQVDIRHGADGAAVSLTVASEAAEWALRQDSDRLKLDSALSAVRISEVRIERAPVGESARSDMGGDTSQRQSSQQQGSQTASAWQQNNSQNMGQSQGQQGRWQSRENSGFAPKSSGDPAVLNHAEARQDASSAGRARYA
ncbi:flagellar hook-length control protein FliK [Sphingobium vermicomposti]|uniref:Flagellar hook-length control protein FliK n=1 Tax=Sphingobium vermicomposti TaxID=529005 RepID=A0A846M1J5_9SPHN|nr:flagellar hook-length control protein FliK [Sphingobium vermicomposti]NIJ15493.1 hypothetical protein [Sphingobium vermicomposti]